MKIKESDRLKATSEGLEAINVKHDLLDDGLIIEGSDKEIIPLEDIDSFGDHRIAMSFLVAGLRTKDGITVKNCRNIETSFPDFCNIMNSLGMKINE